MSTPNQCNNCKNYIGGGESTGFCKAFMDTEIPIIIMTGKYDHSVIYPGDNGIRFEPIEETNGKA